MSYANGTPNYNLPQTVSSDKRDWSDTNTAFLAIDAALKSASDNATQADSKADAAQTTADSAVTTATSAVTTANSASATAQTAAETAQLAQNAATTAQQTATQAATDAQSALTTANAAQQTASNADTVALAAQNNIGQMSDLQTTNKSSLVAAVNEVLSQIGGGGMPTLDFTRPLHEFKQNANTFTATKDCYILGTVAGGAGTVLLSINSNPIIKATTETTALVVPEIKVSAGDVVEVPSGSSWNYVVLAVYDIAS